MNHLAVDIGDSAGKYSILKFLGSGGMGSVYLARDEKLHRNVALKWLNPALAGQESFIREFQREAQALASVYHPNIVHVHSLDTLNGDFVIDMEYLEGGSLADRLLQGPLTLEESLHVANGLLEALACCHRSGFVHRDVKPSNILFDKHGTARLSDFGLATAYAVMFESTQRESVSSSVLWCTPRYAPPEAWDGEMPTPAWDIYATGLVIFECLVGRPPFEAANPLSLVKQMSGGLPQPLESAAPGTPEWLCRIVGEMLQSAPEKRPQDACEVLSQLRDSGGALIPLGTAMSTIHLRQTSRVFRLRRDKIFSLLRQYRARIILAGAVGLMVALALTLNSGITPNGGVPIKEAVLATQRGVFQDQLPDTDALLELTRGGELRGGVYDVYDYDTQVSTANEMLLFLDETQNPGTAIVKDARSLAVLRFSAAGENSCGVSGNWGAYPDGDGSVFTMGLIEGNATWHEAPRSMVLKLLYRNEMDGTRWQRTVSAKPSNADVTDTRFFYELESGALTQPLLWNDLVPAGLAWSSEIDRQLPAIVDSRLHPARLDIKAEADIDGIMGEAAWNDLQVLEVALAGRPIEVGALLSAFYTDQGIFLGISVPLKDSTGPELRITVMPSVHIPLSFSPVWSALIWEGRMRETEVQIDGQAQSWEGGWQGASKTDGTTHTAEIMIPFKSLGLVEPPDRFSRWRLNVVVRQSQRVVAQWGAPDPAEVSHGIILDFSL